MSLIQWFDLEFDIEIQTAEGARGAHYIYDDKNILIEDVRSGEFPNMDSKIEYVYLNEVRLFVDTLGEFLKLIGLKIEGQNNGKH